MKKSMKLGLIAILGIAILPLFLLFIVLTRQIRIAALTNRPPSTVTKTLRNALQSSNEVRFYDYREGSLPFSPVVFNEKKLLTLRGYKVKELLKCLHFSSLSAGGKWTKSSAPVASKQDSTIATGVMLEFRRDGKVQSNLFVSTVQSRWYKSGKSQGDAQILPQANAYVKDLLYQYGFGLNSYS